MTAEFVLSLNDIRTLIESLLMENEGVAWPAKVDNILQRLINSYNASGKDHLLDAIMEGVDVTHTSIAIADTIEDLFIRMVTPLALEHHRTVLDYIREDNALVVSHQLIREDPFRSIEREYRHAQERSDYIPENLRRSFEEYILHNKHLHDSSSGY